VNVSSVPPDSEGLPSGSAARLGASSGRETDAAQLSELMTLCSRGHEKAFAELYDRTSQRIYGIILRVLRSPDHAAEVMQEVYVEVWRQSARYSPDKGSVIAWMTTMAHRRAVDRVRSVSSEVARDERYAFHGGNREIDQVWDGVEQRLDVERVRRGMASLTPIQREALTLAYFGGYTQSQVAQLLKLPLGTVKTRIRDGLTGSATRWGWKHERDPRRRRLVCCECPRR
jgi:RNA polymerase sigma-70 factor (ECF subfamily)